MTSQQVAEALDEHLPRHTSVFHVELIDATGGCTARARVGMSSSTQREIAGMGETLAEAIVELGNRAAEWSP